MIEVIKKWKPHFTITHLMKRNNIKKNIIAEFLIIFRSSKRWGVGLFMLVFAKDMSHLDDKHGAWTKNSSQSVSGLGLEFDDLNSVFSCRSPCINLQEIGISEIVRAK